MLIRALGTIGRAVARWTFARDVHTNVYGIARTLLALGTCGTLMFTPAVYLFGNGIGIAPVCGGMRDGGLFCIAGPHHLQTAQWGAVALLLVIASGWRPRFTGIVHWYVLASLYSSAIVLDGGDQVSMILALLLIPVTLSDGRSWHWARGVPVDNWSRDATAWKTLSAFLARTCLLVIRLQVAGIYFEAAVSKMKVEEWRDGTAVYYWFTDPIFGFWEPVRTFALPVLANPFAVAAMTWGAMAVETMLFVCLFAGEPYRRRMLVVGIGFHAGIAAVHGLPSFAIAMWAALILFLYPVDREVVSAARAWARLCSFASNVVGRWPRRDVPLPS